MNIISMKLEFVTHTTHTSFSATTMHVKISHRLMVLVCPLKYAVIHVVMLIEEAIM